MIEVDGDDGGDDDYEDDYESVQLLFLFVFSSICKNRVKSEKKRKLTWQIALCRI